jgi:predicted dehydrogenase
MAAYDTTPAVAVIGCGWAGLRHARAFAEAGARVRWAVDMDAGRAARLARDYADARSSTEYHAVLEDPQVTAVTICLPHDLHAPTAVDAAQAGKHILCEKPIADSLEAADRMIAAADAAGVVLMIAENVRFSPLLAKVSAMIAAGSIGRLALAQVTREVYTRTVERATRAWYNDAKAAAGGIMMAGGVHDVETLRMLVGEVESVFARRVRQRLAEMEGDDTSVALLTLRDGAVATLVESFLLKSLATAAGPEVHTLRLDGDLGSLVVRDGRTIHLFSEQEGFQQGGTLTEQVILVPEADTFALEVRHFLQCLRTGVEPLTSGRAQRRPLEVVLAAYRSMATGQPVALAS